MNASILNQPGQRSALAPLEIRWLGRVPYAAALEQQEQLVAQKIAGSPTDILLLLEHEPVYTIGRTPDQSSLRDSAHLPHPVVQIGRGGQATYHGPGQLIGYPILDLRAHGHDLHVYLRALEDVILKICQAFQVTAQRREGLTGVWCGERKLASIGVGVRRWMSMHGFALNVSGDLAGFSAITPCGLAGVEMTHLSRESGQKLEVEKVAEIAGEIFAVHFAQPLPGRASNIIAQTR